ncbi:hypothetical protein LWI29_016624 [Acer saccharum]|uniref:non-specific serine/threonine protein kinase n=1 Tax=Acer saccharum TaxID=4024 RepID=A0AA39TEX4_ACESA|nr:hypothetical protein LWI29_016624 [Acer saccharum]
MQLATKKKKVNAIVDEATTEGYFLATLHVAQDALSDFDLNQIHGWDRNNILTTAEKFKAEAATTRGSAMILADVTTSSSGPSKGQTCKKVPVKETTSLILTKNSKRKKMINEYVKERKISRGSYGKVALYRNSKDGTPYAIKTVCKSRLRKVRVTQSESAMENVYREVSILKRLDHPNIVNLFEVIDDQKADHLYMVLDYVKDIIAGLIYLHSHNIVHGDIKPANLLLTGNGRVKIGDFSFSHAFEDENDELRRCPGTLALTPPECYLDTVYHGKAADTWAIGVTLYYIVVGCFPFLAVNFPETYHQIVNSPLSLPEELDPELKDLLQGLLCKDPMQRIRLDVAAEHPWVTDERAGD